MMQGRLYTTLASAATAVLVAACSSSGGGSGTNSGQAASTTAASQSQAPTTGQSQAPGSGQSQASTGGFKTVAELNLDALYAAAKQEGSVGVFNGQAPQDIQNLTDLFTKQFPGIKVNNTNGVNPNDAPQKLITLQSSGVAPPDKFSGRAYYNVSLVSRHLVNTDPGWQALGVDPNLILPDGGLIEQVSPTVLAYNPSVTSKDSLPKTYADLADPKYRGKVSVDPRGFPFNGLLLADGHDATIDLVKKIKANGAVVLQGATAGLQALSSGHAAMRLAYREDVLSAKAQGQNLDYVYLDQTVVDVTASYVPANAKHPNAGKLYAAWFSTAEPQNYTLKCCNRSNTLPSDIPSTTKVIEPKTLAEADEMAKITTEITGILSGQ